MKLIKEIKGHVLVEMEPGEAYPGYKGVHTSDFPPYKASLAMLSNIADGNAFYWTWDSLMHYTWKEGCVAVITKHDYDKLNVPKTNEWGEVSP